MLKNAQAYYFFHACCGIAGRLCLFVENYGEGHRESSVAGQVVQVESHYIEGKRCFSCNLVPAFSC